MPKVSPHLNWNIPNAICVGRLVGSLLLIPLALVELRYWFLGLYLLLAFSDWIDGQLARRLKQKSTLGARLDTYADAVLNICLLIGVTILCWSTLASEIIFVVGGVGSYFVSCIYCISRFNKLPAYHSYMAKVSQFLVVIAAIFLVLEWSVWPLRLAAASVMLTNLEAILITAKLKTWQADILSVFGLNKNTGSEVDSSKK